MRLKVRIDIEGPGHQIGAVDLIVTDAELHDTELFAAAHAEPIRAFFAQLRAELTK